MVKRGRGRAKKLFIVYIVITLILIYILVGLLAGLFKVVQLSPFYPDFAPFDASVTILTNTAPYIENLEDEYFICEGNRTEIYFNVSDNDGNLLQLLINDFNPNFEDIFLFAGSSIKPKDIIKKQFKINSIPIGERHINLDEGFEKYREIVSACESPCSLPGSLSDSKEFFITLIEINNVPKFDFIGVQTLVWTYGDNNTFYHQVDVLDEEDGDENSGNLNFDITFLDEDVVGFFDILDNGTMVFIPKEEDIELGLYDFGLYNIEVCVEDMGIDPSFNDIVEYCGRDGGPIKICNSFGLTITDENRAPEFTSNFPFELNFTESGNNNIEFNITARDPDLTIPDVYWYVDGIKVFYDNNTNVSFYTHNFGCGVEGLHKVKVDLTDGLLNNTLTWNVTIDGPPCPPVGGGGGGGGGGRRSCEPEWSCLNWYLCQDIGISYERGLLDEEDFSKFSNNCELDSIGDTCGIQLRDCNDLNYCNNTINQPELLQHCNFIKNPSCEDGIKNCHNGKCEVLIDCGGSCGACPSCSDGIKNQGEEGKDCGGPCPLQCIDVERTPFNFVYIIIVIILFLLVVVIMQIIRIYFGGKRIKSLEKIGLDKDNIENITN